MTERIPIDRPLEQLAGHRVLVTGAAGSLGSVFVPVLEQAGVETLATDVDELDVGGKFGAMPAFYAMAPTLVFHLAAAKHAPEGEIDPAETARTNIVGTQNILDWLEPVTARVVLASTCKAADPETVYGASKLIAERIVLNAGGSVARFYNIMESSGNVFEHWQSLPPGAPLPVTPCSRYFISLNDAVALLLWSATLPAGRYTVNPGESRPMADIAAATHPGREIQPIPPRRGDRLVEPRCSASERLETVEGRIERIVGAHDPVDAEEVAYVEAV